MAKTPTAPKTPCNLLFILMLVGCASPVFAEVKPDFMRFSAFYGFSKLAEPALQKKFGGDCAGESACEKKAMEFANKAVAYLTHRLTNEKSFNDAMVLLDCAKAETLTPKCESAKNEVSLMVDDFVDSIMFESKVAKERYAETNKAGK